MIEKTTGFPGSGKAYHPTDQQEYLLEYWKFNVRRYAHYKKIPRQHAALELNRQLADVVDPFNAEFIERYNKRQERWFYAQGAIVGAITLTVVQIIIKAIWGV